MRTVNELQSEYEFLHCIPYGIQTFHRSLSSREKNVINCYLNPTFTNCIIVISDNFTAMQIVIAETLIPVLVKASIALGKLGIALDDI